MDFELSHELDGLAAQAAAVAADWKGRTTFPEDSWIAGYDAHVAHDLAARGWLGMTWPTEWGGGGRPAVERLIVFEQLISGGVPLASFWFADRQMGPTLLQFGTDEQRRRWLPGILAGTDMWCIGMSEPDNGSDIAHLRTRAVPAEDDSGDWIVNGQKVWTSGAALADWMYLVARTDADAPAHQALSEFVLDMSSPGVEVRRLVDMTGDDHFCEVHLSDVRVPGDCLVGSLNGSFGQLMRQMEHERGGIDRLVSNRILFEDVMRSGWVDTSDPLVRQELARIETAYRIGRLLVLREVLGQAPQSFSAATKTFCTEFEQRLANFVAEVAGARGIAFDRPGDLGSRVARAVAYAPAYTIMGGTSNILRNVLAERVLGLPRR